MVKSYLGIKTESPKEQNFDEFMSQLQNEGFF